MPETLSPSKRLTGLHLCARRWFQKTYGNTYHTVVIYGDGKVVARLGITYGYGEQWLQTALEWLAAHGYAKPGVYGTAYLREELGGTYSVTDVTRQKDLYDSGWGESRTT